MKKFCIVQDITSNPDDMMYLAWNKANDCYFWTSKETFDSLKHNDVDPHKFTFDTIMEAAKCAESIGFQFEGNIICIDVPECVIRVPCDCYEHDSRKALELLGDKNEK